MTPVGALREVIRKYLHGIRRRNATAVFEKRLAKFDKKWIFDGERMADPPVH